MTSCVPDGAEDSDYVTILNLAVSPGMRILMRLPCCSKYPYPRHVCKVDLCGVSAVRRNEHARLFHRGADGFASRTLALAAI